MKYELIMFNRRYIRPLKFKFIYATLILLLICCLLFYVACTIGRSDILGKIGWKHRSDDDGITFDPEGGSDDDFGPEDILGGITDFPVREVDLSTPEKQILIWNTEHIDQSHLGGCPDWRCTIVRNKSLAAESDAILFYEGHGYLLPDPAYRKSSQYYVYFALESPAYSFATEPYPSFYNLTMTYRRDSDAPCVYGYSHRLKKPITKESSQWKNIVKIVKNKSKLAAWFVSNCKTVSKRQTLAANLSNFLDFDTYGQCGTLQCPRTVEHPNDQTLTCDQMLTYRYKFYFAFENSLCKDYVTEKFWHRLTLGVVPVVLKRAYVQDYAPPHSFVAVDDFSSLEALADYLLKIDRNDGMYLKFFEWRLKYRAVFLSGAIHDRRERFWGFCKLCQILRSKSTFRKTYDQMQAWWSGVDQYNMPICSGSSINKIMRIIAQRNEEFIYSNIEYAKR